MKNIYSLKKRYDKQRYNNLTNLTTNNANRIYSKINRNNNSGHKSPSGSGSGSK